MKVIIVTLLMIFISCTNRERIEEHKFENGSLMSKHFYKNKKDTIPFKVINYYKDGNLKEEVLFNKDGLKDGIIFINNKERGLKKWTNYKNGHKNGLTIVEFNNGSKTIQPYKNDSVYGIQYFYNEKGKLFREQLWIEDLPIAEKRISEIHTGDTILGNYYDLNGLHDYMYIEEDSSIFYTYDLIQMNENNKIETKNIGSLLEKSSKILDSYYLNNYHKVTVADTISYGESLNVNIKGCFSNFKKDVHIEVEIGEMDSKLRLYGKGHVFKAKQGVMDFSFKINKYDKGYNLLLGKVKLVRDTTVIKQTLLFEDFYVIP